MTILHLEILLHYYVSNEDYDQIKTSDTRLDYAYDLAKAGCLYIMLSDPKSFCITSHGKKIAEKILEYFSNEIN